MKKQMIALILAAAMILSVFAGCASSGADTTTVSSTTVTTAPETTAPEAETSTTAPPATEATNKETVKTTEPKTTTATDPSDPQPPEDAADEPEPSVPETSANTSTQMTTSPTNPPTTDPPATEPPSTTAPPETEPPHSHSYSAANTVAPDCDTDGYTVYQCSCGESYTDDTVSATGHSWSDWTITREATSSAEGEQSRTCSSCSATETATIEKLPAEQIDTAALEAYGRQYGENNYDFVPEIGVRDGYYPGDTFYLDNMDEGYKAVAASVKLTADWLMAAHGTTHCYLDVEVVHEGGNQYCVWVYYG